MPPKVNKVEVELKKLTKQDGNKTCADCPEKMPGYADLSNRVFVCTKCAGIHRDFQFKIKGISMSVFTEEDVKSLSSEGNVSFNAKYMANYNTHDPVPNGSDVAKLKEFIRAKYLDRKWFNDGSGGSSNQGGGSMARGVSRRSIYDNEPDAVPQPKGFGGGFQIKPQQRASIYDNDQSTQAVTQELDLLSMTDPVSASPAQPPKSQFGNFDPFGDTPAPQQKRPSGNAASFDAFNSPQRQASGNASSFDAFGSAAQQQQQKRPSGGFDNFNDQSGHSTISNGFDAFSSNGSNGSTAFDPFASGATGAKGFDAFSSPPPKQGGFDGGFPPQNQQPQQFGGSFSNFNSPPPQMAPQAPMPFIKLAPPAPEPVPPATVTPEVKNPAAPPAKNFSAFDDLLEPVSSAPLPALGGPSPITNPFDAQQGNGPASAVPSASYGGHSYPAAGPHPNYPPSGHLGVHPGAPYGYPPHQHHPGYPPQFPGQQPYPPRGPAGPPHGYPPQHQHPGYPPQGQHLGYPPAPGGYPPQHQGPFPGYPPNGGYSYPPTGAAPTQPGHPGQPSPASAQAPIAAVPTSEAPDPFASMSGAAWGAVGGKPAPSTPYVSSPASFGAPNQTGGVPSPTGSAPGSVSGYVPTPNQTAYTSSPAPAAPPAASVNPFDMF